MPFGVAGTRLARIRVTETEGRLQGSPERFDERGASLGERLVDAAASECHSLGASLALAMAVALDPHRLAFPEPPPPSTPPGAPTTPEPPPELEKPWSRQVAVGIKALHGPLPSFALGASTAFVLSRGGLRLEAGAELHPRAHRSAASGEIERSAMLGTLTACAGLAVEGDLQFARSTLTANEQTVWGTPVAGVAGSLYLGIPLP